MHALIFQANLADHPSASYVTGIWGQGAGLSALAAKVAQQGPAAAAGVSFGWAVPALHPRTRGHHVMVDTTVWDGTDLAREVPLAPLFVRDLTGRILHVGPGPLSKSNDEWEAYRRRNPNGTLVEDENPFIPLITCPRHVAPVEGELLDQLENILLCHWRPLEMALDFRVMMSGDGQDEAAEPVVFTYMGANLYPYKLRLDTFYADGYRLPQTNYVFARGFTQGVDPTRALTVAEADVHQAWLNRPTGQSYEEWLIGQGGDGWRDRLFHQGVTLIPTFEACNGYHVVGPQFELEDYWPGRAVAGLHQVVQSRADAAPLGTILQVLQPGYVTGNRVVRAQVVVSDGSGYVSPNAQNPVAFVPNLNLPHQRMLADWRGCWLPTHPEHFEEPAIWGWEPETGRLLQLSGPLWDPLHYHYASYPHIRTAHDTPEPRAPDGTLPVPPQLKGRFWPIVPMFGFDTFHEPTLQRRIQNGLTPRSLINFQATEELVAGVGYHPMPMEFEFELEPFWFPEFHPDNRGHGPLPEDLEPRLAPLIRPRVGVQQFIESVTVPFTAVWFTDPTRLVTPVDDPLENFPFLARYLIDDLTPDEIVRLCPTPFLSDASDLMRLPVQSWWEDANGQPLDSLEAWQRHLGGRAAGFYDGLWDARQKQAEIVKFRHMLHQTNLLLYIFGWWSGASVTQLQAMLVDWIAVSEGLVDANGNPIQPGANPPAEESPEELQQRLNRQQAIAMQQVATPIGPSRPSAPQASAVEEDR